MNSERFKKGEVLVPVERQYPADALAVDGYDEAGFLAQYATMAAILDKSVKALTAKLTTLSDGGGS